MDTFIIVGQLCLILFEMMVLAIILDNLRVLRRLGDYPVPTIAWPVVSVLIPARNERANIRACVESILAQHYPNFEVIVLDDHSTDETAAIVADLVKHDSRLTLIKGQPLAPGWLGKHWACHQLAQAATGDVMLFTDADTRHHPLMLPDSVAALHDEQADLLTALPQEQVGSWSERLLIPLMVWSMFAFVPLRLAYRLPFSIMSVTIGQFMLFRRAAFEQIGGFAAVRDHVADDLALGRRIKKFGFRWRLVDGGLRVQCRMYHNFRETFDGLSKNLFGALEYKLLPYLFVWSWLALVFWGPLLVMGVILAGVAVSPLALILTLVAMGLAVLLWSLIHWRFGFPRYLSLLYPVTILLSVIIALRSMLLTFSGGSTWKGRSLSR